MFIINHRRTTILSLLRFVQFCCIAPFRPGCLDWPKSQPGWKTPHAGGFGGDFNSANLDMPRGFVADTWSCSLYIADSRKITS